MRGTAQIKCHCKSSRYTIKERVNENNIKVVTMEKTGWYGQKRSCGEDESVRAFLSHRKRLEIKFVEVTSAAGVTGAEGLT